MVVLFRYFSIFFCYLQKSFFSNLFQFAGITSCNITILPIWFFLRLFLYFALLLFFSILYTVFGVIFVRDVVDISAFVFLFDGFFNIYFFYPFISISFCTYDNLGLFLMLLSAFLVVVCVLISLNTIKYRILEYLSFLIFLDYLLIYFFSISDLLWFFMLYELVLVPMFLLITVWGSHSRKIHAGYQFFFYTYCGSLPLFVGLCWILSESGVSNFLLVSDFLNFLDDYSFQGSLYILFFLKLLWLGFFIGFSVKIPIYPFHIWLPEAHVEASTAGSVILAGILLKMGIFGLYRTVWIFLPNLTLFFEPLLLTIAFIGIFYTTLITLRQVDLKKIIAYSSVGHMGFCLIGLAINSVESLAGAFFILFSHGFISSFLFILIGFIYERYHTRNISYYGGLVFIMPSFVVFLFLAILANMSFPTTCSFVGEILILVSFFEIHHFLTVILALSIIFSGVYCIWVFNRISFGFPNLSFINKYSFNDLSSFEIFLSLFFLFFIFLFGIKPSFFLFLLDPSIFFFGNFYLVLNNYLYI